jgi:hypothetical protein
MSLSPDAEAALSAHAWPGNIRELENVIQRALIMAPGNTIGPEALNCWRGRLKAARSLPAQWLKRRPVTLPEPEKRADNMKDLERDHILRTLAEVGGSRKKAIERLGISERTLRYKLQQYRDEGYFKADSGLELLVNLRMFGVNHGYERNRTNVERTADNAAQAAGKPAADNTPAAGGPTLPRFCKAPSTR